MKRMYAAACAAWCLTALVAAAANTAVAPEPREKQEGWMARHEQMNERVKQGNADLVFIGDSITHGWEGAGKPVWDHYYADRNAVNLGIGGDRTQHVIWRLENGNIDGISPKVAVVMIGTNNHKDNSAEEISEGVTAIVRRLRNGLPDTKVLLLAIFPRGDKPEKIVEKLNQANTLIADLAADPMVTFLDLGPAFRDLQGQVPESLMPDLLHPNEAGYQVWASSMEPVLAPLLGVPEKAPAADHAAE
ncbi:MAG: GDSL family lipase [Candidatus Hydrogenedentes bacterium]|nr:GDSL family lipase [Candidatus Hydrogenedentota bacterium]